MIRWLFSHLGDVAGAAAIFGMMWLLLQLLPIPDPLQALCFEDGSCRVAPMNFEW